ncbi:hypothetical protein Goshw_012387 [Gossypium schwendimanii]|uniref:Uncharacterized protein n=1 Tax=Gossypium schwendimanii TaxID=34291 RepID=A0A7J9KRM8_GOSSC|nr:hypothetical protein [Gossypium schwendimanii]
MEVKSGKPSSIKINFDGAYDGRNFRSASGAIARNVRGRLCSLGQRSTMGSCPPSSLKPLYVIEHGNGGKNGLGGSYNGGGFINHSEKHPWIYGVNAGHGLGKGTELRRVAEFRRKGERDDH